MDFILVTNSIIGRKDEQSIFQSYIDSPKAELIAVYGRRRVGKTYLIKSFFDNKFDFAFSGMYNTSKSVQLAQFQAHLEKYSGKAYKRFKEWSESGLIEKIFHELGEDADLQDISIDSTYIKAHKASAGAERGGSQNPQMP